MREPNMRRRSAILFVALLAVPVFSQEGPPGNTDQAAIVAFAEKAAVRALAFRQGDAGSLNRARADFTSEGWRDFLKHMEGYLDRNGAPTFDSSFAPSGKATVLGQEGRIIRLRIPGILKQTHNQSSTTYRGAVEVYAGGKPVKLQRLEQIACAGASTACQ